MSCGARPYSDDRNFAINTCRRAQRLTCSIMQPAIPVFTRGTWPLDFRGTPVGIDAALVCRSGQVPLVNTGIAGRQAGVGQVGAGLVEPPIECFNAALSRYGVLSKDWFAAQQSA